MNLLNNYINREDINKLEYIPSLNEDLIVDFSTDVIGNNDYSFIFETSKNIQPKFSKIYSDEVNEIQDKFFIILIIIFIWYNLPPLRKPYQKIG